MSIPARSTGPKSLAQKVFTDQSRLSGIKTGKVKRGKTGEYRETFAGPAKRCTDLLM
jgi:hypothetical protein